MEPFLERAYSARLRLSGEHLASCDGPRLTHSRVDVGCFTIDDVLLPGDVQAEPDPLNRVAAVWATGGRILTRCDRIEAEAAAGEVALIAQHDRAYYVSTQDMAVTSVLIDPVTVAGVAAGLPSEQVSLPIHFESFQPVNAAAGRLWKQTVNYVKSTVLAEEAIVTPLVIDHACRLLAAVTLSTFPHRAVADPMPYDRTDHQPALLRRAIGFIEANVAEPISLADIADAVHITPRAVQYMFRRHLDTTPMQYLRDVRLRHAHNDLVVSNRMNQTVTSIAAKWGFMHTGRFAVLYRQMYGVSPHETLRG